MQTAVDTLFPDVPRYWRRLVRRLRAAPAYGKRRWSGVVCPSRMLGWSRPEDLVGATLNGRYRLLELLGEGGMAAVFSAHHLTLDSKVAVKVLGPSLAKDPRQRKRFVREARSANRIVHEHVVTILDFAEDPMPYFVMEQLEGEDLGALCLRNGRLPWPRVKTIALQVLSALEAAHHLSIVHRDIKPSNIFMVRRPDGRDWVKVLDFGVAKIGDDAEGTNKVTHTNEVLGTALYMSPEQALGQVVDARTDLYSLGVVLHQLLAGSVPFMGTNPFQVIRQHLQEPPPPLSSAAPGIPPAVETIVLRALAKDPNQRFASARVFAEAIMHADAVVSGSGNAWAHGSRPGGQSVTVPTPPSNPWAVDTGTGTALGPTLPPLDSRSFVRHRETKRALGGVWLLAPVALAAAFAGVGTWWALATSPARSLDPDETSTPTVAGTTATSPAAPSTAATSPIPTTPPPSAATPTPSTPAPATAHAAPTSASPPMSATGPSASPAMAADPGEIPPPPPVKPKRRSPSPAVAPPEPVAPVLPAAPEPPVPTPPPPRGPATDDETLGNLRSQIARRCSASDPGAPAMVEVEVTREGRAYPEVSGTNAAAKACIRDLVRATTFASGKSRAVEFRITLRP